MNIQEQIEELQGTCDTLDTEMWSIEELQELDNVIFQCATCGWWCDIGDQGETDDGEMHCTDCCE